MGTHPIFESDFDCLTEIMFRQIGRHLARRAASAKVTQPAPAFSGQAVVNGSFQEISLEQYTSEGKWVLFFFYPLDFTFVCPTELIAFSDMVSEFADNNCQVVACSVDSHFSHLAWNNMPRNQGGIATRGLFLIDPNGILRHSTVNDLPVGRSPEEALRVLQAFQFVEEHGEVCPANWKPGKKTINPAKAQD